jgi:multiple inositol-polyphosphate phosphatase/2,3-bisphosphoglycerate 3-phosphatase
MAALAGVLVCMDAAAQGGAYPPPLGTKTLYVPGKDTNAAIPSGYSAFFISHVGRHGARHVTNLNELTRLDGFLQQMADAGGLLPDGLRLRDMVHAIMEVEKKYTPGTLTTIGGEEQYGIGKRMGDRYSDLLRQPGDCLRVTTTTELRTEQSAEHFLDGLAPAPGCLTRNADDTVRLRFFSLCPSYTAFAKKGEWKQLQKRLEESDSCQAVCDRIVHRLFDTERVAQLKRGELKPFDSPQAFLMAMYSAAVIVPGLGEELGATDPDIFSLLSPGEAEEIAVVDDAKEFFTKGPGLDANGIQVRVAAPLLADFLTSADEWLRQGKKGADLRFAHAETVAPIAALMELEGAETAARDPFHYSDAWKADRVMGYSANIQWVFYRGAGKPLLKVLYNERPVHLPVKTDRYPYYEWKAVREYYWKKLGGMGVEKGTDMYKWLQGLK